ncbi:MAG TPA: phosphatidate cytidylyltransferase [Candidatus Acidoferrales bacterium]|nr:phosphatidate cytidylyltransferase [Candidatus Acidoferrales bacterium]
MGANLRSRAITALVAIPPLVLLIVWGNPWIFAGLFFLATVAALREYFAMVFPHRRGEQLCGIVLGSIVSLMLVLPQWVEGELWFGLLVAVCLAIYIFVKAGSKDALKRLAWLLLGCVYLGYLLPYWVLLFRLPHGRAWVLFVLWVIMAGDTMAYFVGGRFGTRKLAPRISPGKTVEGAWGYIAGSVIAGFLGTMFLVQELHWLEAIGVAVWLSILGQVGDLFESWLKRIFVVKDSGNLLPGHGGLLDRLDSLIFPAVFTTAYIRVFHS